MASFKFIHVKSELAPVDQGARKKQIAQVRRHAASVSHKNKRDSARAAQWGDSRAQIGRPSTTLGQVTVFKGPTQGEDTDKHPDATSVSHVATSASSLSPTSSHVDPGFGFFRTEVYQLIPHGNDIETLRTLDFYTTFLQPEYDLVAEVFNVTNAAAPFLSLMSNDMFFHALMSQLSLIRTKFLRPGDSMSAHALSHRSQALSLLSCRIASHPNQIDDITICTIVCCALFENASGNQPAFRTHLQCLKYLVEQRGGVQNLNWPHLRTILLSYDSIWTMLTGSSIFPNDRRLYKADFPQHPFAPNLRGLLRLIPPGIAALVNACELSWDTIAVLQRTTRLNMKENSPTQIQDRAERRYDVRPYDDVWCSCPSLLLVEPSVPSFDKATCLAIHVYCCTAFSDLRLGGASFVGTRHQLSNIVLCLPCDSIAEKQSVLWMWLIAIDSWRSLSHTPTLASPGDELLAKFYGHFEEASSGWQALSVIVERFFWSRNLSRFWSSNWDELVARYVENREGT